MSIYFPYVFHDVFHDVFLKYQGHIWRILSKSAASAAQEPKIKKFSAAPKAWESLMRICAVDFAVDSKYLKVAVHDGSL